MGVNAHCRYYAILHTVYRDYEVVYKLRMLMTLGIYAFICFGAMLAAKCFLARESARPNRDHQGTV